MPDVAVDPAARVVSVGECDDGLRLQSLAGLALPAVAQAAGGVVLHACAAVRGAALTVVCGASGAGKSTLLVALVEAGWKAVTEDLCVLHDAPAGPVAWPGPGWVRLWRSATPPPLGLKFPLEWKAAWDLEPCMQREPAPASRIVFLERSGAGTARLETLSAAAAIPELVRHQAWYGAPDEAAPATFPRIVRIASAVPRHRLVLPRSASSEWLGTAVSMLS